MALDTSTANQTITGYFKKNSDAEDAVDSLKQAGFSQSQISVAVRPGYDVDDSENPSTAREAGRKAGGMWHKMASFFGSKSGTSAAVDEPVHGTYDYDDDLRGSFSRLNVSEEDAGYFGHQFSQGEEAALVTVTSNRAPEVEAILKRHHADTGEAARGFAYPTTGANSNPARGAQKVQLFGEVLQVHKDRIKSGEVTVRKNVITENKTVEVPVSREELVVTREPVSGQESINVAGSVGESSEVRIPLTEERVCVTKQNVVLEDVTVGTRTVTDTKKVSENVRHEELNIDDSAVRDKTKTA